MCCDDDIIIDVVVDDNVDGVVYGVVDGSVVIEDVVVVYRIIDVWILVVLLIKVEFFVLILGILFNKIYKIMFLYRYSS